MIRRIRRSQDLPPAMHTFTAKHRLKKTLLRSGPLSCTSMGTLCWGVYEEDVMCTNSPELCRGPAYAMQHIQLLFEMLNSFSRRFVDNRTNQYVLVSKRATIRRATASWKLPPTSSTQSQHLEMSGCGTRLAWWLQDEGLVRANDVSASSCDVICCCRSRMLNMKCPATDVVKTQAGAELQHGEVMAPTVHHDRHSMRMGDNVSAQQAQQTIFMMFYAHQAMSCCSYATC